MGVFKAIYGNLSIFGQNGPKFSNSKFVRSHIVARRKKSLVPYDHPGSGLQLCYYGSGRYLELFFFKNFKNIKFGPQFLRSAFFDGKKNFFVRGPKFIPFLPKVAQ